MEQNQISIFRNVSNILPSHPTIVTTLKTVFNKGNKGKVSLHVPSFNKDIHTYNYFFLNFPTESLKAPKSPPSPPCNNPPLQTKAGKWRSGVKERCCSRFRRDCWTWTIRCLVLDSVDIVEHLLKDKSLQIWWFASASHRTSFLLWHTSIKVFSEKWKVFGLRWNIG